ncbi:MAG TPA: sensor histidine kinase, partial [Geminicoccaceae bacterium]|nr:sensor histidine kinase [Geminicoccaceae bacterium]
RPEVRGLDLSDTPYFRELLAGADQALSDPAPSRITGMRPVHYVEWVKDEAGRPVFALGTAINPRLLDQLHAGMVDQATAASALFKPDGTFVAGVWPSGGIDAFGDDDGWIIERAPVPGWPLVAVAGTPTRAIWRDITPPSATVLAAVLLLSAGIVLLTQAWQQRQRAYAALVRTEAQQRLLLDELNHRVRNILATFQSVAIQTLRGSASLEEFERAFAGRLEALSRASTVLAVNSWRAAELGAIVETALAPYRGAEGDNVRLDGPEVTLPPKAALTLSLVLHELATNAAKYGALSAPGGRVAVTWRAEAARGRPLSLDWTERDGPRVDEPTRCGFGRRLIERSVAYELGGASRLEFPPEGARCRIELPLEG